MAEIRRKINITRLYILIRGIVLMVSGLSLIYSFYCYHLVSSNKILNTWEDYCSKYPGIDSVWTRVDCMGTGLDIIDTMGNNIWTFLVIGIILPVLFFGGTALYRYLYPVEEHKA